MTPSQKTPAHWLADAFAAYVDIWAKERNTDAVTRQWVARLARHLSLVVSDGHVCLPLAEMAQDDAWADRPPMEDLRDRLLALDLVGTPDQPNNRPMILDEDNRLYLHRYFDYERTFAQRLLAFRKATAFDAEAVRSSLDVFFGTADNPARADWQRIAAALAIRQRLAVISGGPGTGKTTTVANILGCLLAQNQNTRIILAAPTGKAAMRMLEAIRARATTFPAEWQSRLPKEAFTLHRLLGMTSRPGFFRHHAGNPLTLDTLVVDEASMIDLALASRLFDALPPHARLILLGDKDQLSAVAAGAIFSELSADPGLSGNCLTDLAAMTGMTATTITPPQQSLFAGLTDSTVWLTQNFRFAADSGISRLALAIRDGQVEDAKTALHHVPDGSVIWVSKAASATLPEKAAAYLQEGFADYLATVTNTPDNRQMVFDAFERFRVLCATHEGRQGVSAVNALMTAHFRNRLSGVSIGNDWYVGRPVMVQRNDYTLRLFNGDIGIALPDEKDGLTVYFPSGPGDFRAISPSRLPEHETAFAMTIHKSQGSEFESLLILMPPRPIPLITRELLYTAVTRARKKVALVCSEEVLESGILSFVRKHSGLMARLRELELDTAQ